jgi:hypothetical protein
MLLKNLVFQQAVKSDPHDLGLMTLDDPHDLG